MGRGARRSKKGHALEVAGALVPAGSTVVQNRSAQRRSAARKHFERVLGGRHPAARRIHRRIVRLERELQIGGGGQSTINDVRTYGDLPRGPRTDWRYILKTTRVRGVSQQARAAILWRRLARYRLGNFRPDSCQGAFVARTSDLGGVSSADTQKPPAGSKASSSTASSKLLDGTGGLVGLSLERVAKLAEIVAASPTQQVSGGRAGDAKRFARASPLPGRDELLLRLGDHCEHLQSSGSSGQLTSVTRVAAALAHCGVASTRLLRCMEATVAQEVTSSAQHGTQSPQVIARALVAYSRSATAAENEPKIATILALLTRLSSSSQLAARKTSVMPLELLQFKEVADALEATCVGLQRGAFARGPRLLDIRQRVALRRFLRSSLLATSNMAAAVDAREDDFEDFSCDHGNVQAEGPQPPDAKTVARLVAAWLWLSGRRVSEATKAEGTANTSFGAGGVVSPPPAEAVLTACRQWAISPQRSAAILSCWREGRFEA
eukprot:TRINITY_DN17547_c3_g1_i1.p1 TRINITY_DN17547_c3_g1~~TRINITY_DN17547_c3_g1_i1.p1  ORF type:complete len:494 (-),score=71.39 TRINITY_DN17547_c3_g1_i1:141-1622(-)